MSRKSQKQLDAETNEVVRLANSGCPYLEIQALLGLTSIQFAKLLCRAAEKNAIHTHVKPRYALFKAKQFPKEFMLLLGEGPQKHCDEIYVKATKDKDDIGCHLTLWTPPVEQPSAVPAAEQSTPDDHSVTAISEPAAANESGIVEP